MVDVEFVGQLVDSMEDAVLRLEKAVESGNVDEENKLRVFIFDLHKRIAEEAGKIDGRGQGVDGSSLRNVEEKEKVRKVKKKRKRRKRRGKNA